jgi:hypothetical protein
MEDAGIVILFNGCHTLTQEKIFVCFQGQVFSNATFFLPALVKTGFTTGQIAYIWTHAALNTVYFGDLSEASARKTRGFRFEKAILI